MNECCKQPKYHKNINFSNSSDYNMILIYQCNKRVKIEIQSCIKFVFLRFFLVTKQIYNYPLYIDDNIKSN